MDATRTPRSRSPFLEPLEPRLLLSAKDPLDFYAPCPTGENGQSAALHECLAADSASAPGAATYALPGETTPSAASGAAISDLVYELNWQGHLVKAVRGQWVLGLEAGVDAAGALDAGGIRDLSLSLAPSGAPSDLQAVRPLTASGDTWLLEGPEDLDVQAMAALYEGVAGFRYLEPDFVLEASRMPDDPLFPDQWALHNIGQSGGTVDADVDAPEAWDDDIGSEPAVVAVIDTGVDYTHPDLADHIWCNPGEVPDDGIDNDGNGFVDDYHGWDFANGDNDPLDDEGHGSHCSGIIGAVADNGLGVAGVNWDVQIMGLKFLDAGGAGATSHAVAALNYATMMRQDYGINVLLTSNSWGGGGFSTALRDAIAASGASNMLFVAAAGNGGADHVGDNNDVESHYPSNYDLDNIIAVAATDRNDTRAGFSNYGPTTVDLGAPGVDIVSTVLNGNYSLNSGTSMATPYVAGVAALAWSAAPGASYAEIRDAIFDGVDPVASLAGITVTGGRLNADRTLAGLTRPGADVCGGAFLADPSNLYAANGTVEVSLTVRNVGQADAVTPFDVQFYLSDDATIDPSDSLLVLDDFDPAYDPSEPEAYHLPGLAAGSDHTATVSLAVPAADPFGTGGPYYVGMIVDADADVAEASESNNANLGAGADLAVVTYAAPPAEIRGAKWADANQNGTWDAGEQGLAGWTIYLDLNQNGELDGTAGGTVSEAEPNNTILGAMDLEAFDWSLGSNPDIPMSATVPHISVDATGNGTFDYYAFSVDTAGSTATFDTDGTNFDTELFLYDLSGTLLDANDDAGGDPGSISGLDSFINYTFAAPGTYVIGVGRYASSGNTGGITGSTPDAGDWYTLHVSVAGHTASVPEPTAVTGAGGTYAFVNVQPGQYTVREVNQPGWVQTAPADAHSVTVEPAQVVDDVDFGNYPAPGSITGTVWYDADQDAWPDGGEPGLADWTVYLDMNENGQFDAGDVSTDTAHDDPATPGVDETGSYAFTGLLPGTYTVREVLTPGWTQTYPGTGEGYAASPVTPAFQDISGTGSPRLGGADDQTIHLTSSDLAGFTFDFFGTHYTDLYVSSNGLITFGSANAEFSNRDLTSSPSQAAIAAFWDDLRITGAADSAVYWQVLGSGDDQKLVIQWHHVEFYSGGGEGTITFQAVLRERTGDVQFNYADLSSGHYGAQGASATVGIKDAGTQGDDRLLLCYNDGPNAHVGHGKSTRIRSSSTHVVDLPPGGTVEGVDFGNWTLGGTVTGTTWYDADQDGQRDTGEPGLAGWTVYADLDEDGNLDDGEPFAVTLEDDPATPGVDESGTYSLSLSPGTYQIREVPDGAWVQTFPTDPAPYHTVTVAVGDVAAGIDFGNWIGGAQLTGRKWFDIDQDGERDAGEPGLAGWTIYLDLNDNGQPDADEPFTVTADDDPATPGVDETGGYTFTDLPPGTYVVAEVPQDGWEQTCPAGDFLADFEDDDGAFEDEGFTFVDAPAAPGTNLWHPTPHRSSSSSWSMYYGIEGVWNFATGARNAGYLHSPAIELADGTATLAFDYFLATENFYPYDEARVEISANQGASWITLAGNHVGGLADGSGTWNHWEGDISAYAGHTVVLRFGLDTVDAIGNDYEGWYVDNVAVTGSGGSGSYTVSVPPNGHVGDLDFGNWTPGGTVTGTTWYDADQDGQRDAGEPGLAGWTVYADLDEDGNLDDGEPFDVTREDDPATPGLDETGTYGLILAPGTYQIRQVLQADWTQTFPADPVPYHTVTADPGGPNADIDFGTYRPTSIRGIKWYDTDRDGERDAGERGLPGWTVYLDLNDNGELDPGEPTTQTSGDDPATPGVDETGGYAFTSVPPGTYSVAEVLPPGWEQTYPHAMLYSSDFEADDGGWTATADWHPVGDWEWGTPTSGPGSAYSGQNVWATNLDANYTNAGGTSSLSQVFDFTGCTDMQITWREWVEVYYSWDTATLVVNGDVLYQRTTSSPTPSYQQRTVDLSAYDGLPAVEIAFELYATTVVDRPGWYIDDVAVGRPGSRNTHAVTIDEYGQVVSDVDFGNWAEMQSLDTVADVTCSRMTYDRRTGEFSGLLTVTNTCAAPIDLPLWVAFEGLSPSGVTVPCADGYMPAPNGAPYIDLCRMTDQRRLDPGACLTCHVSFLSLGGARFTFTPCAYGVMMDGPADLDVLASPPPAAGGEAGLHFDTPTPTSLADTTIAVGGTDVRLPSSTPAQATSRPAETSGPKRVVASAAPARETGPATSAAPTASRNPVDDRGDPLDVLAAAVPLNPLTIRRR